jgi:hypothetical protein
MQYAFDLFAGNYLTRPVHSGTVWCMIPCRSLQGNCPLLTSELRPGNKFRHSLYCGDQTGECYERQRDRWQTQSKKLDAFLKLEKTTLLIKLEGVVY